ncbi:hypothetical protein [Trichocoleus sp. DQ-U1]|uniref:hypothetical protein n=1 Tax=Trichocoleus sp. DQ-U1 TaxID=2933926 RepID=UPI00329A5D0A
MPILPGCMGKLLEGQDEGWLAYSAYISEQCRGYARNSIAGVQQLSVSNSEKVIASFTLTKSIWLPNIGQIKQAFYLYFEPCYTVTFI